MDRTCVDPITHMDRKGYLYCARHAARRHLGTPTRKLLKRELAQLENGKTLSWKPAHMNTISHQVKDFRKDLPDGRVLVVHVRHDDSCRNGHNSFSITCDEFDKDRRAGEPGLIHANGHKVWLAACGMQHDVVREHFPDLVPYLRWHLMATDGPLHYIANTTFWAREGNLENARSAAVWPDATKEQLLDETALRARLPRLLADFRLDVESLGLTY